MKLSIIVPFHRGMHFLEDCFESIREQNLSDFQTILVLDHVKEDISELIHSYQDLNLTLIYLNDKRGDRSIAGEGSIKGEDRDRIFEPGEHSGVAVARNAGLDAATGEYVYFLDSDDFVLQGALSELLGKADEKNADFAYGMKTSSWYQRKVFLASLEEKPEEKVEEDHTEGENIEETDIKKQELGIDAEIMKEASSEDLAKAYYTLFLVKKGIRAVSVLGVLCRRSYLNSNHIRFQEEFIFFSDFTFMVRVLQYAKICSYVPEAVYVKRKHNDPIHYPALSQLESDKFEEYLEAYQQAREYTKEGTLLRGDIEDKLITNFVYIYAPRLRRSENDLWRTERFEAMRKVMLQVSKEKINGLKGYKKKLITALLNNNVWQVTMLVTKHLGIKKAMKIRKNRRLFAYYLYNKFFFKMPMKENWVMCESFFGKNYSDSPKYIYEYMNNHHRGKYRFIWVINQKTKIPYQPVRVKRFGIRYCYYLARSKYFVFNGRQPDWFRKKDNMVFLETWHGTPLKRLVFDQEDIMAATPLYKAQFYNQSRKWDYLVAANRFSSEIFRSAFLFDKEMLEYGYPRNDILHHPNKEQIAAEIKQQLEIVEGKKTILYAPTWRDDEYYGPGEYKFALKLDLKLLKEELGENCIVLLRTHYFIADSIDVSELEGFVYNVSKYDDISELYLISDILITDYSSVFFDYANLKRPILFFTYDLDKYRGMLRGFYMDIEDEVPGPLLFTSEEVVEAIRNIDKIETDYREKYDAFYTRFCSLEDGHASENIVKRVFDVS